MKPSLLLKLFPVYVGIIAIFSYWTYNNFVYAKPVELPQVTEKVFLRSKPVKIIVPSLSLEVNIEDGNYDQINKSWNVSNNNAQFISISDTPNPNTGNTVIYAHNTKNLFGQTTKLDTGDKVYLLTEYSNLLEYEYVGFKLVNPSDVSVLENSSKPKLTLITCSGIFNEKRRIMEFDFTELK